MPDCLLGLGSNEGDREATLRAAIQQIDALPDVLVKRHSEWHRSTPIGGPDNQGEFLNAAVLAESSLPPLSLLDELQDIERRHGRQRGDRWAARTLDIDLLLYGNNVSETEMLTLPHPRMSFRRFALEPAAEVAPRLLHPVIGWPIRQLLLHLYAASDQVAILSTDESLRAAAAELVTQNFTATKTEPPQIATAGQLWPADLTTWLRVEISGDKPHASSAKQGQMAYAGAALPKLSIVLDARSQPAGAVKSQWSALVRKPGRGPTLRLQFPEEAVLREEVLAAIAAVWPDLGPAGANRLE